MRPCRQMGAHTSLQSVIIQENGSGRVLGQGLEGSGVIEGEHSMKNEKGEKKLMKTLQFIVNYIKRNPRISLFSSFCMSQQKKVSFCSCLQHMVQYTDLWAVGDVPSTILWQKCTSVFILGSWSGSRECKTLRAATNQAPAMAPQKHGGGCPRTLTSSLTFSCIYRGGLISTLFPCSHMSRCEAGPGGKRVALSRPGRWALESCASASPDEGPTSHGHWDEHKHHLFYIKSVRLNKESQ